MSEGFFEAIRQGNKKEVERRLRLSPSLIHARENGLSPILVAAYHHEPEIASFLADKTVALTIFEASATGKLSNIIRMLARDPQLVNTYCRRRIPTVGSCMLFRSF